MKRLFIVNPAAASGRGLVAWRRFAQQLDQKGIACEQRVTSHPGQATEFARQAAAEFDLVVAVGGDGTVFEVLNGLLHEGPPRAALAVVPTGTGNDAAAAVGCGGFELALEAFQSGKTRATDVIQVNCEINGQPILRHALLFAAAGITSEVLRRTTPRIKRIFGPRFAYSVGLLQAVWTYRAPKMRIEFDGKPVAGSYLLVAACNCEQAGGGMKLAPGAAHDDGYLNLNLIEAVAPFNAFRQILRVRKGLHIQHPQVWYHPIQRISIDAQPSIAIEADGESIGRTPARFEVKTGLVRILSLK